MTLPSRVALASHNIWLIPFAGPWIFGRISRLKNFLATKSQPSADQQQVALRIVAVQEAWAFRCGPFWPLLWLWRQLEAALLRFNVVAGGREPYLYQAVKCVLHVIMALPAWMPLLRRVLWDPKPELAAALRARAALPWSTSGAAYFASETTAFAWPPVLMDSGLLLCASQPADESGFVPYPRRGSSEAAAGKGMLWARWGALGVVNTHMTFQFDDGGV